MSIKKQIPFEMKCNKCGKQQPQESDSTDNWKKYKAGEKCECGGEYVMHMDDAPFGKCREQTEG